MKNRFNTKMYWDLIKKMDVQAIDFNLLNKGQIKFINAIEQLFEGYVDETEMILKELFKLTKDEELKENVATLLLQIFYSQDRWDDIISLGLDKVNNIDSSFIDIVSIYHKIHNNSYDISNEIIEKEMTLSISGSPVIEIKINGSLKKFWIDTGAVISAISQEIANLYGVKLLDDIVNGQDSTETNLEFNIGIIDELVVGNLCAKNHPVAILPEEVTNIKISDNEIIKIDGVIGWDIIHYLDIELDFNNMKVTTRKTKLDHFKEANLFFCGFPIVKLNTEDYKNVYFGLDTGANATTISKSLLDKEIFDNIYTKVVKIAGAKGYFEEEVEFIKELTLKLDNEIINLKDISRGVSKPAAFFFLDGILGIDIVKNSSIRIDFPNKNIKLNKH